MSEKITNIQGKTIPMRGNDIDTDRIIPARFMKCLTFDGLGQFAFYDEKYGEEGKEKENILNNPQYERHSILISNKNFGCGSSREHAPWALKGMGITCIIAESFAEIFANNCSSLGIPALICSEENTVELQKLSESDPQLDLKIDLVKKTITTAAKSFAFELPENYRIALIEGKWDTTSILLDSLDDIRSRHESLPQII